MGEKERERVKIKPGARIFIELPGAGEDNQTNLGVAEDRQLFRLLKQPISSLRKRHLPARRVIDPSNHNLPSPHIDIRPRKTLKFFARSAIKSGS